MAKSSKPQGDFKDALNAVGNILSGKAFKGYHTDKQESLKKAREKRAS